MCTAMVLGYLEGCQSRSVSVTEDTMETCGKAEKILVKIVTMTYRMFYSLRETLNHLDSIGTPEIINYLTVLEKFYD